MLIVCTEQALLRLSDEERRDCAWVYLGKDLRRRGCAAARLGEKGLIPLGVRLHQAAETLRQPYLDFMAELGGMQADRHGWWSSSCGWKDTGASDLFLLICYEHVVGQLACERQEAALTLVVVIEDLWLFRQLTDVHRNTPGVECRGRSPLWLDCARAIVQGTASRAVWTLRLVRNYVAQARVWTRTMPQDHGRSRVAFYSYPQARCVVEPEGWTDPYLSRLDDLLEHLGYSVIRFSPPEVGGFEEVIARRRRFFRPLILHLTFSQLLRAFFATWRPVWPRNPEVAGRPIGWLLRREWWRDRWRSSYFLLSVFFDCVSRFLETERPRLVIFPYENQPWEKLLVLAARARGIPTLAYQHGAGLCRFMLAYFHGRGEGDCAPLPEAIVTSGPYAHDVLSRGGTPPGRLVMGGSLRFQHLCRQQPAPLPSGDGPLRILVTLPIEVAWAEHLLDALRRAFPDGGRSEGLEFVVRPHPMSARALHAFDWPAAIGHGSLEETMRTCPLVVYTATSTGVEALAMGHRVLRYRSELLLDLDVTAFIGDGHIVDCGDHDLRSKILAAARESSGPWPPGDAVARDIRQVFVPMDERVWTTLIGSLAGDGQESGGALTGQAGKAWAGSSAS